MRTPSFKPGMSVTVKTTAKRGRGVFAVKRISAGDIIETAPALVVPREQIELLASTFLCHYMFKSDNNRHLVIGLGISSMLNHSDEANAEFLITFDTITIRALKAISVGSEVTIDYRWRPEEWSEVGGIK